MNSEVRKILQIAKKQNWLIINKKDGIQLKSPCGNYLHHIHCNHQCTTRNVKKLRSVLSKMGLKI